MSSSMNAQSTDAIERLSCNWVGFKVILKLVSCVTLCYQSKDLQYDHCVSTMIELVRWVLGLEQLMPMNALVRQYGLCMIVAMDISQ